jgi:hypothetical protein
MDSSRAMFALDNKQGEQNMFTKLSEALSFAKDFCRQERSDMVVVLVNERVMGETYPFYDVVASDELASTRYVENLVVEEVRLTESLKSIDERIEQQHLTELLSNVLQQTGVFNAA